MEKKKRNGLLTHVSDQGLLSADSVLLLAVILN